jgi:hypothetical protein
MLHKRIKIEKQDFRKYSFVGILARLREMLWPGTGRTNNKFSAGPLEVRFKTKLDLAERMRKLGEAVP